MQLDYYNQYDERYANKPYGTDNVGHYGCGPSSFLRSVTGVSIFRLGLSCRLTLAIVPMS